MVINGSFPLALARPTKRLKRDLRNGTILHLKVSRELPPKSTRVFRLSHTFRWLTFRVFANHFSAFKKNDW